ncbi:Ferrous iron transport protein B [Klebsiella pneumoniae]|uniref:Ferrous iron transport protein B n=1 Tax=Klebsiella pneumoniae TaxID=573 RepID=A0A4P0YHL6_KLEPN|nr:Ferrous iron transport protein B [Klebsiella pneumoniae]
MLINVVDASNLERNLYLTLQLLELGIPCVVALNMLDIAEKQQVRIRYRRPRRPSRLPGHSAGIDSRTGDRSAEDRPRPSSGEQRS